MGFSTWSYGPDLKDISDTYQFIEANSDVYSEQIDHIIPWKSWIDNKPLPKSFTDDIAFRVARKNANLKLILSVSLLNTDRTDLLKDVDGAMPTYTQINDLHIINAYYKHVKYLVEQFNPSYLIMAMEVNDLYLKSKTKWSEYTILAREVRKRLKADFPALLISESVTLHNLYQMNIPDTQGYLAEIKNHINEQDFCSVSFYPFFKGLNTTDGFQKAFDFLNGFTTKPIAFSETCHIAENLDVNGLKIHIKGTEKEQNQYLETLLINAQKNNYHFVIWWCHRDFNKLWNTFDNSIKDVGKLWRNTGILDQHGKPREAHTNWKKVQSLSKK